MTAIASSNDESMYAAEAPDRDALLARYREERQKRLRTDGNQQFRATEGALSRYVEDPYADTEFSRDPVTEEVDVAVIGGGLGGLTIAARLIGAGVNNLRIIEKAGDFGGTWYWNRYPGAACDVESYIYMPLLEDTGYIPKEKYARGPELLAYLRGIGEKYGLYSKALLQTQVTEMRWNEERARWIISTQRGDAIAARFVCSCAGPFSQPKLPAIPGIEDFRGHAFHTSRWDYDYTGGDASGNLGKLADKRVGVIGTGATAVQCVPSLAESAERLYVFQRTPSSIGIRANAPTDPKWAASLQPGWQRARMDNFSALISGMPQEHDLVADGWTTGFRRLLGKPDEPVDPGEAMQAADIGIMNDIRSRVDTIVGDAATADALKPYYNWFCKRPCFHDEYLQAFNQPNVTLVNTQGKGVERITSNGAIVQGREIELDCLIYATGFEVGTGQLRHAGYEIYGRSGLSQSEAWADGVSTLHGLHSRNFPNRFIISNAQSAAAGNYTHIVDEVSQHLAYIIKYCVEKGVRTVEPTAEAEQEWVDHILSFADNHLRFSENCTPGYFNNEGQHSRLSIQNGFYLGGPTAYISTLQSWRAAGDLPGLEIGH